MVYCEIAVKASFTGYPVFNEKNTPMLVHKVSEAFESKKSGEEIVLFLDGELIPLIHSVEQGMHIAFEPTFRSNKPQGCGRKQLAFPDTIAGDTFAYHTASLASARKARNREDADPFQLR
ncbi:hypothetical protein ABE142_00945 [Paenibacillus alvei]|uniref:hypothetical protein n=1 Tax=Paenibacillus alvei TaxID=44250 RepID=UPI0013DD82E5|nr:hypothetical protein [Paenibacillus alvei]NEZ45204.1 hypothetical protein [Paenibacillus alvei]